jgi:hypothetical protein
VEDGLWIPERQATFLRGWRALDVSVRRNTYCTVG